MDWWPETKAIWAGVRQQARSNRFKEKKPLSEPEQVLYKRLREALPECVILAQVEIQRLIEPLETGTEWWRQWGQIRGKSLDFVVCLPDFTPVAAVELDDRSHLRPERMKADRVKNEALKEAGIALLRWNVRSMPSTAEIRRAFTT